jgi:hypothetical protein
LQLEHKKNLTAWLLLHSNESVFNSPSLH